MWVVLPEEKIKSVFGIFGGCKVVVKMKEKSCFSWSLRFFCRKERLFDLMPAPTCKINNFVDQISISLFQTEGEMGEIWKEINFIGVGLGG